MPSRSSASAIGAWAGSRSSIGKLAIYTAAGGIDPDARDPGDAGRGHQPGKSAWRSDVHREPAPAGPRRALRRFHRRLCEEPRRSCFPNALLQWEDFGAGNGRRILEKYRDRVCTFNDDMQGTGAIALAAAVSAVRVCGTLLRNQRIVIFGAGTAGIGIADQIRDVMICEGLSAEGAAGVFGAWTADGLLTGDMGDRLHDYQATYARPAAEVQAVGSTGQGNAMAWPRWCAACGPLC